MKFLDRAVAVTVILLVVLSTTLISYSVSGAKAPYEWYVAGNPDDVTTTTSSGLLLAGGGEDVAEAMEWMIAKSGGGDFVVIRCSGTDAYNPWVYTDLGGVDSCETIIFLKPEASYDNFVIQKIRNAEALFIAGGNQGDYVRMWKGTPVEDAIHYVFAKNAPVGGTSAGLAVLGEFAYAALKGSVDSVSALRNPYTARITLENDFLQLPGMEEKITDSHFVARDRMGRLVTFLARIVQDGWATQARGIGINEETALAVEPDGEVKLFAAFPTSIGAAYFLQTPGSPEACLPRTPLTYTGISVYKMSGDATFNILSWSGVGGAEYTLSAVDGVLVSSQANGAVY